MRGRYAPSPTGLLHLGNARTALVAWLQARKQNSSFVLRIEDLDSARCKVEFSQANLKELKWLGFNWDEGPDLDGRFAPYIQSQRFAWYEEALEKLKQQGHVFECFLSRKDLRELASAPHGKMPHYGVAERKLNEKLKEQKQGKKEPSLRFQVNNSSVTFTDAFMGLQSFELGDFIVKRADGEWAYQLAVVIDDIAMGIDEVVRGSDLLESSAAQLLLYKAFDAEAPSFFHIPLLNNEAGERLSKRKGSLTLTSLKSEGVKPEVILGLLAFSLGLVEKLEPVSLPDLLVDYQAEKLSKEAFNLKPEHLLFLESI